MADDYAADWMPAPDDDEVAEQQREMERRKLLKQQRILTGEDARIDSSTASSPTMAQEAAALPLFTLADYESKWGFTLEELKAATRVVTILFNNPALFVGDPHLAESRLYTMVSRDRKTKRENKDVYKQVMNEEKSRRDKTARQQDVETIKKTTMKKERDDALNALLLPPQDEEGLAPLLLTSGASPLPTSCHSVVAEADASSSSVLLWRSLAAFEAAVELQRLLRQQWSLRHDDKDLKTRESLQRDVAHCTSTIFRFLPHAFGSQMSRPVVADDDAAPGLSPMTTDVLTLLMVKGLILERLRPQIAEQHAISIVAADPDESVESLTLAELRRLGGTPASPLDGLHVVGELPLNDVIAWLVERGPAPQFTAAMKVTHPVRCMMLSVDVFLAKHLYTCVTEQEASWMLDTNWRTVESPLCTFPNSVEPPTADQQTGYVEEYEPKSKAEQIALDVACYCREKLPDNELTMNRVQKCHTCKGRYQVLHPFYYSLCRPCGEYNYNKRLMTRDLRGKVVLLTGCRIKIGYAMAISLLRCGATLLGTTRFSHDALARFTQEPDYSVWKDQLHLYSLDLRDMWMVTQFCGYLAQTFPKLFAVINNAAQTIARTKEYTAALRQQEVRPPAALREALSSDEKGEEWYQFFMRNSSVTVGLPLEMEHHPEEHPCPFLLEGITPPDNVTCASGRQPSRGLEHPSGVVATMVTPDRRLVYDRYDTQAEAMDLREKNSWTMNLHEVHGSEAAEVMAINALSPFVLNSRLKPLLANREGDVVANEGRFIINVSAMEGQFYRYKQTTHPHTNMAKAALNMMTRTSAEDYAQSGIYMNSVDTGWITDESPVQKKQRRAEDFMLCPLDEVDAAARCLDLIYMDSREYGKFWKDFHVIPW